MTRAKDDILQELTREEQRLAELERSREEARVRVETLRSELAIASEPPSLPLPLAPDARHPRTSVDKVKLFRSLFRGRPDVFPLRFVSKKTGKPGSLWTWPSESEQAVPPPAEPVRDAKPAFRQDGATHGANRDSWWERLVSAASMRAGRRSRCARSRRPRVPRSR